jgi:hypothetical protein
MHFQPVTVMCFFCYLEEARVIACFDKASKWTYAHQNWGLISRMQYTINYRTVGNPGTKLNVNKSLNTFSASGPIARHINIQTPRQTSILQGEGDEISWRGAKHFLHHTKTSPDK